MSSHHRHLTWTFAVQDPKDPREARYNAENAAELNSGAALAIVDKQPSSTIIDNLRDWEKDAVYEIARPHRSRRGFSLTDLKFSSPEKHIVGKPSTEEQLAVINHGKLMGSLEGGKIVKIHQAEDSTGAIPVMDCEVPGEIFYYIPAQIERLAMSRGAFETKPSFLVMKDGEMPSYVFWNRKAEFPPSYSESDLMEQHRAIRSGAPTPEARPAPLAVNINKAAEAEKEKQAQPMWGIFDPRLEEDPLEFLEYYNVCLNGRKGIRNKLMLREADIDRVNYISPCLAHNHKEIVEESGAATTEAEETAMDVDPVPIVPSPKLAETSTPKTTSPVASKPWVQPGPIPDDDPSWLRLLARQDRERQIRGARIRPKPVFTSEFCNTPGTTSDPKKAVLRRELYDEYYHRAVTANREIESRSKCCLACGLQWTQCTTTRQAHYKQHRDELKLYRQHCQNQNILLEDPFRVESLDPAKAPMINNVPALNWFRDLEQIILNVENELLEREQTCRICDAHVDFADESMADHYEKHAIERKQLRTIGEIANSVPTTPTVIVTSDGASVINGTAQSSPAAAYTRPSTTPEYLRRIYEKLDEERVKKALKESAKMADIMVNVAEQIRETGTLSSPISLSSGSKSSEPVVAASDDVMDTTEDGPIHSDVIGNTTAQRVLPPFMTPMSQSPKASEDLLPRHAQSQRDNLDFLSKYDAHTVASEAPTSELDYYLDQLWSFSKSTGIPRKAAKDAYGMIKLCFESGEFTEMDADLLFVACGWIACRNNETPRTLQEFSELCGYSVDEIKSAIEKMPTCFDAVGPSVHSSPRQNRDAQSEVIVIQDDDSDLYASPVPGPVGPLEEQQADNDQAEIVQAIRSNSGELLALDDAAINDSEDAEEVLDAGVIETEAAEEMPEEFEVDVEDDAEEVPKEFGRIEVDDAENSDGSARSEAWYPPDDGLFDNLEPSPELSKASDLPKTEIELDAAKLLAHAMGQKVLRRMKKKLDLEKAFLALESTEALIFTVENEHRDGLVTHEQEIYGRLLDRLFTLDKKIERNRPVNSDQFNFRDVYLTPEDLLNGVHLKWYDIWRVVNKAKEAFLEWVAQNSKDSLPAIREQIVKLLRCVLKDTSLYGYSDEPFPIEDKVPVRHDRLDLRYGDLRIDRLLTNAHRWGCGFNNMTVLSDEAWKMAKDMVKAERASPSAQGPEVARLRIFNQVQKHVRSQIRKEKRWRLAEGQRLGQQGSQGQQWATQVTPEVSSAKWSTEAVASTTPRTPFNSPWTPGMPSSPSKPSSSGSSKESSKRKRPASLPTPVSARKRKASDDVFQPGPPTPFNPDEVSPRMPKKPRKSSDPLYRPGSALLDPTTPPESPTPPKRSFNRDADGRFAKKVEKKPRKKQEKKVEKKKGKKVTFDAALSSKSSTSAPLSSTQVVITKKASAKKPSTAVTTKKTSKTVAPKSPKSGVKKTAAKDKKAEPVAAPTKPKRQAAIEAEKSFGKTKIVG